MTTIAPTLELALNLVNARVFSRQFDRLGIFSINELLRSQAELVIVLNGLAMGTRVGPSYANSFVDYVEHQVFNQYDGRYIDDCIGAISSSS